MSGSFGGLTMMKCVPAGGAGKTGKPAPLVVALHGYTQTAQAYQDTTEWHVLGGRAAVAGGPYGCTTGCMSAGKGDAEAVKAAFPTWWNDASKRKPRLLVVQGDKDNIVSPTNLGESVKQWLAATGTDPAPANAKLGIAKELKGYPYAVYSKDGSSVSVASLTVTGMAHATPVDPGTAPDQGGKTGSYAATEKVYSAYCIAKFFGLIP